MLLLVEDAQYADLGLLDFLEHLVDWSREIPLLVLGFTRPELADRRRASGSAATARWSPSTRSTSRCASCSRPGPGLPADAAAAIERQAQGIPLFAVETVRSLIDRQVVRTPASGYSPATSAS